MSFVWFWHTLGLHSSSDFRYIMFSFCHVFFLNGMRHRFSMDTDTESLEDVFANDADESAEFSPLRERLLHVKLATLRLKQFLSEPRMYMVTTCFHMCEVDH